jgi:hypothetical protein
VASWDDVRRICLALPEAAETTNGWGQRSFQVRGKGFVWERPLRQRDLAELGDAAPTGTVLAAHVPDEGAKRALIADDPAVFFTTHHFDGYPAVLARLELLDEQTLIELAGEAWACRAPAKLRAAHRSGDTGAPPQ